MGVAGMFTETCIRPSGELSGSTAAALALPSAPAQMTRRQASGDWAGKRGRLAMEEEEPLEEWPARRNVKGRRVAGTARGVANTW